jgi:hypothetical protein
MKPVHLGLGSETGHPNKSVAVLVEYDDHVYPYPRLFFQGLYEKEIGAGNITLERSLVE